MTEPMADDQATGMPDGFAAVSAGEAGFDPGRLADALAFAESAESRWPRSMVTPEGIFIGCAYVGDRPPYNEPLGPVRPRGGANGIVLKRGRKVASWGDTGRVDMTFSVAKSLIALLAGVAVDRGLIGSIDERVGARVTDGGFADAHNAPITWRHLLEQTSEWHGTLFDRPDSVDWNRKVGPGPEANLDKGGERALSAPGTHFEYNDVRVNRLSLSLLRLFREPLPDVFRTAIMDPIGASDTWRWDAYANATVDVDGTPMPSVPGGGHWGGGVSISAGDLARIGELVRRRGVWDGKRLLSADWIDGMLTPSALSPTYGHLWWLNTDQALYPDAPTSSVFALGGGSHVVWVDAPRELVVVARWVDKESVNQLMSAFIAAVQS